MSLRGRYSFVSDDRPDRFAKAVAASADRAIPDIEDAARRILARAGGSDEGTHA